MLPAHPKFILIHNELPIEEQYPDLIKHSPASSTFLYLSNFIQGKGQNFALEAFARIHEKLPTWKLRFVGGDMGLEKNKIYKNQLQQLSKSLGIVEKIEWAGFTESVEREYKLADIVLNFSESESFSITCLEALYFGKPLIATDCGGPSEIIDQGESGILVKNKSVDSMSEAMLLLAQNRELQDQFSAEGKKRSRNKFSIEQTSYRLRDIYNSISKA
jgi:glycosyltransferase involved in cell wall biosynthesis